MKSRRTRMRRPCRPHPHLHVESLEGRIVLSASIGIAKRTGLLTIVGTATEDTVVVSRQGGSVVASVTNASGTITQSFPAARVRSIAFSGLEGADSFTNDTSVRCRADGGAGNDILRGGRAADVLIGGDDDDQLFGNGGNDTASGGTGDDVIRGGTGKDRLLGEDGFDTLFGEEGNDDLSGGADDDGLDGGDGNDVEDGGEGSDDVFGGTGNDRLKGGFGNDYLSGGAGNDDLAGDAGDDTLDGDEGDDRLNGGSGNDDDLDDEDELEDESGEDEGSNTEDEDGSPSFLPIVFGQDGTASVTGTSANREDKRFYSFVAGAAGRLTVTVQSDVNGRAADLEIEDRATSATLLELEPSDGGVNTGSVTLVAGRSYSLRLRSPDLLPVSYTVSLRIS